MRNVAIADEDVFPDDDYGTIPEWSLNRVNKSWTSPQQEASALCTQQFTAIYLKCTDECASTVVMRVTTTLDFH